MANNNIVVGDIVLTAEEAKQIGCEYETVEVAIRYEIGGMGGFDWTYRPRGYQLDITPYRKVMRDGKFIGRQTTLLGGVGGFLLLEEAARKNPKRMQQLADSVDMEALKAAIMTHNVAAMRDSVPAADRTTLRKYDRQGNVQEEGCPNGCKLAEGETFPNSMGNCPNCGAEA